MYCLSLFPHDLDCPCIVWFMPIFRSPIFERPVLWVLRGPIHFLDLKFLWTSLRALALVLSSFLWNYWQWTVVKVFFIYTLAQRTFFIANIVLESYLLMHNTSELSCFNEWIGICLTDTFTSFLIMTSQFRWLLLLVCHFWNQDRVLDIACNTQLKSNLLLLYRLSLWLLFCVMMTIFQRFLRNRLRASLFSTIDPFTAHYGFYLLAKRQHWILLPSFFGAKSI